MDIKELNTAPDSISLHDASLVSYCIKDDRAIFRFCLGSYHYYINEMEGLYKNEENELVLDLIFDGVYDINIPGIVGSFQFVECSVLGNYEKDNTFHIDLCDICNFATFEFKYKKFEWLYVGEFSSEQYMEKRENLIAECEDYLYK